MNTFYEHHKRKGGSSFESRNPCPRKGTRFTAFFQLEDAPLATVFPRPWREPCLAANLKASATHNNNHYD